MVTDRLSSVLETSGSITMPITATRQTQKASSTTVAPMGAALWSRHHSSVSPYLSWMRSNQGHFLAWASFRMVEAEAGTTVIATSREAIRQ